MRVITTATARVSVGTYARVWRAVKSAPARTEYTYSLCSESPATREAVLSEFTAGLEDRINRHVRGYGVGRKWSAHWQTEVLRVARAVNTRRQLVHARDVPPEFRARLAHRLTGPDDF